MSRGPVPLADRRERVDDVPARRGARRVHHRAPHRSRAGSQEFWSQASQLIPLLLLAVLVERSLLPAHESPPIYGASPREIWLRKLAVTQISVATRVNGAVALLALVLAEIQVLKTLANSNYAKTDARPVFAVIVLALVVIAVHALIARRE